MLVSHISRNQLQTLDLDVKYRDPIHPVRERARAIMSSDIEILIPAPSPFPSPAHAHTHVCRDDAAEFEGSCIETHLHPDMLKCLYIETFIYIVMNIIDLFTIGGERRVFLLRAAARAPVASENGAQLSLCYVADAGSLALLWVASALWFSVWGSGFRRRLGFRVQDSGGG